MELSALRAPRPIAPTLSTLDKRAQLILHDLEKITTSKRERKKLKRSEELIHRIVQSLRRTDADHILYSVCIRSLIEIFRLYPNEAKEMMLNFGVPGVLLDMLRSGILTGHIRQYASELCFFLRYVTAAFFSFE